MARVKIKFPFEKPLFTCIIPVRITDINYGNHLGNDSLLSMIHEARMQMLSSWGLSEMDAGGNSLIMADVMIAYKNEAFYGSLLEFEIFSTEISECSFELLYRIKTIGNEAAKETAHAKTGMVCFDYSTRKITLMSSKLKSCLQGMEI